MKASGGLEVSFRITQHLWMGWAGATEELDWTDPHPDSAISSAGLSQGVK